MSGRIPPWAPPLLAVQFLTRVPVPALDRLDGPTVRAGLIRAVGWFPLVGALVGCVTAAVALGLSAVLPLPVAVLVALMAEAYLTGAFHEDAVADFCDGFGGGATPEDVRRIMKDSRIGTFGALGLGLAVSLRAALLHGLVASLGAWQAAAAIVASACFGRLVIVFAMAWIPPVPTAGGLAKDVGAGVGGGALALGCATALPGLAPLAVHDAASLAISAAGAAAFLAWLRATLLSRLGGSTGDCLGFAAYAGQLILLIAVLAGHGPR